MCEPSPRVLLPELPLELPSPPNESSSEPDQDHDQKSDQNSGSTSEHGGSSSCSAATTNPEGNSGSGNDGSVDSDGQTNHGAYSPTMGNMGESSQDLQEVLSGAHEKKRRHVKVACERCNRCHLGCDQNRPCRNCVRAGVTCTDTKERKKRGRKRKVPLNPFGEDGAVAPTSEPIAKNGQRGMYISGNTHHTTAEFATRSKPPTQPPQEKLPRKLDPSSLQDFMAEKFMPEKHEPTVVQDVQRQLAAAQAHPFWESRDLPPFEPLPSGSRYSYKRSNVLRRTPQSSYLNKELGISGGTSGGISPTILEECMTLHPSSLPVQWQPPILDAETLQASALAKEYPHPKHPAYDQFASRDPSLSHVIGPFLSP